MKWVKLAIGVVIAVILVGVITTSVYNMTKSQGVKDETVTFEIIEDNGTWYVQENTYNNLLNIIEIYSDTKFYFIKDVYIDNVPQAIGTDNAIEYKDGDIVFGFDDIGDYIMNIKNDDTISDFGDYEPTADEVFTLIFEIPRPPRLTGITAILLLLAPLIFAGGVLTYMLNKQEF